MAVGQVPTIANGLGSPPMPFGDWAALANTEIVALWDRLGGFATAATLDSDAQFDAATASGYFSDYDCKARNVIRLVNGEDQSGTAGGGFRDALFVQHRVTDATDYTAVGQKVAYAGRFYSTGPVTAGAYSAVYQDLVGVKGAAVARTEWTSRGVSGGNFDAEQLGSGIGSGVEALASNPAASANQAASLASLQGILSGKKAAADGSHTVYGALINNLGKLATAAFVAISAGTGGDNGRFDVLLRGDTATVETALLTAATSASGNVGTRIQYATGDYTEFDIGTNTFNWAIASSGVLSMNASAGFSSTLVWQLANGAVGAPTFSFINDTNTGIYRESADSIGLACGGVLTGHLSASGLSIGTAAAAAGMLDVKGTTASLFTRDIAAGAVSTPQSAMQLGIMRSGAASFANGVGPSLLLHAFNSADSKQFMGRISAVWENITSGAEAAGIEFAVRTNTGDTTASTVALKLYADKTVEAKGPLRLPSFTVAGLPTGSAGDMAYASNGRKNGEGGGAGTGVVVFKDGTAWRAVDTGATAAA